MRVGVIGCGRMGRALGRAAARAGHEVLFGSRDREAAEDAARAAGGAAEGGAYAAAAAHGGLVLLATRWQQTFHALSAAGDLAGRVLIDATNPSRPDGLELVLGHVTSGAEEIARAVPRARVVKAFNHVYAELLGEEGGPRFGDRRASAFYCGDDASALDEARDFIASLAFDPVFAGPLQRARLLEPLAQLAVELVEGQGNPPAGVALALLRTEPEAIPERRRA